MVALASSRAPQDQGAGVRVVSRLAVGVALVLTILGTYSERWGWDLTGQADAGVVRTGEAAPPLELSTLDGTSVSLEALRGRVVVLNFWATWCGPCRVETPELQAFGTQAGDEVAIIGVNVQEPPSIVAPFVSEYGVTYPIVLDEAGATTRVYRVTGLPTSVFLDRSGIVRDRFVGPMTRDVLERRVQRLL